MYDTVINTLVAVVDAAEFRLRRAQESALTDGSDLAVAHTFAAYVAAVEDLRQAEEAAHSANIAKHARRARRAANAAASR